MYSSEPISIISYTVSAFPCGRSVLPELSNKLLKTDSPLLSEDKSPTSPLVPTRICPLLSLSIERAGLEFLVSKFLHFIPS